MRLRFTIRDLLWVTALVALAVALWLNRRPNAYDLAVKDDLVLKNLKVIDSLKAELEAAKGRIKSLESQLRPPGR
jgi:hypothetical protein